MNDNTINLQLFKGTKDETSQADLLHAVKEMHRLYDVLIAEGFSEEFIAIYLAHVTRGGVQ